MNRKPFGIAFVACATVGGISALSWIYIRWLPNAFFSTVAGMLTYMAVLWLISTFRTHWFDHDHVDDTHTQIMNAISEVARGNFNVFIPTDEHAPHSEMAAAFNKMARDLGDLDAMRQNFISNVSHEIQSPLTSIKGFAALLKDGGLADGERKRYAEIIENESRRLSALSDNLLKLSALESEGNKLAVHTFRLDRQLQRVALTLEPQWSAKNIRFEAGLARCEYAGDADLLEHVWMNLMHNAVKFAPENGDVRVELALSDSCIAVTVCDSGAGVPESDMPHIFERFYKADKSRDRALGGSGLGLSIVKKIVDMHGGTVSAQSETGKGTVFTVTLPVTK